MKKFVLIVALMGCALVYLQQQSYAEKVAHKEYSNMEIKECNSCHKSEGVAPNHDSDFVRGHRVLASKAGNNCNQCHEQKWCLDCHQGGGTGDDLTKENFGRDYKPKSHRSDFITIHPIKAQDNPQSCYRCHDTKYCNDCHSRFPMGNLRIKSHLMLGANGQKYSPALGEHATEARRNLQSCQACHPDGDVCIQCHSAKLGGTNPHPRGFKSGNYKDRSDGKVCQRCHLPGQY
ncbi:MAG: cytochrome C [Geobacter sp.]|nr:MAG: cytochrome C [Geobacter sp.]